LTTEITEATEPDREEEKGGLLYLPFRSLGSLCSLW